jgi:hypothetical protein
VAFEQHPCPERRFKLFWSSRFFCRLLIARHIGPNPQQAFELLSFLSVIFARLRT